MVRELLRQLSNKKAGLQKRVDTAKEQYKLVLDELKSVQELIDKEQQQLTAQSQAYAYAKLLKEETKEAVDKELPRLIRMPTTMCSKPWHR